MKYIISSFGYKGDEKRIELTTTSPAKVVAWLSNVDVNWREMGICLGPGLGEIDVRYDEDDREADREYLALCKMAYEYRLAHLPVGTKKWFGNEYELELKPLGGIWRPKIGS